MKYIKPKRTFEKSGEVLPDASYFVPLEGVANTDDQDMKTMVDLGRYFSIFAPRQSGKTTYLKYFCRELEEDPTYIPILLSFQRYRAFEVRAFFQKVEKKVYSRLIARLRTVNCPQLDIVQAFLDAHSLIDSNSFYELFEKLNELIRFKKIVIFIDEFDGIPIHELENFLVTLRELYQEYKSEKDKALYSVGLVGIRNITKLVVGGVSPFNIADQVSFPPFSLQNIRDLYSQYTEETNQPFEESAVVKVHEETAGQPWLVNRLGAILTKRIKSDTTEAITGDDVDKAVELLIREKSPHFDNLSEKLALHGDAFLDLAQRQVNYHPDDEEQSFLEQYGLIREENGKAVVANPIYKRRYVTLSPSKPLSMTAFSDRKKKLFISYSRKDKHWLDLLIPHLGVLKFKEIEYWFDEKIRPGENWSPEIQNAIETSQAALCLVSAHFLNSKFIQNREIPELLKRRKIGVKILPILVEHCPWKHVPWLSEIQIRDQTPLSGSGPGEQERKIAAVVDQIVEIFDEIFFGRSADFRLIGE